MRIGRYPQGYLELLSAKSNGTTPPNSADYVQPVIDMADFYAAGANALALVSTVAVSAAGFWGGTVATAIVPQGEWWRVHNVTIFSTALAAATAYRIRGAASQPLVANAYRIGESLGTYAVGERPGLGWDLNQEIFGPGWSFGLWAELVTLGTNQAFSIAVEYDRLT